MAKVSRADRKCVRELFLSLESDPKLTQDKITNFRNHLLVLGIPHNSSYFDDLGLLEKKLIESKGVEEKGKNISDDFRRVNYSGSYFNQKNLCIPIKLNFRYDHLFISRHYKNNFGGSPGIKVSWRFESDGELYLIDSLNLSSRKFTHILGPIKNSVGPYYWPKNADFLFHNLPEKDSIQKVGSLLRWGYGYADGLLSAIYSNDVQDSRNLREGELGLTKVSSNPLAMAILEKSSKLKPFFIADRKQGTVVYN